ncbi:uncharacterized protein Bfra_008557, partial [Botrytis fragariae]
GSIACLLRPSPRDTVLVLLFFTPLFSDEAVTHYLHPAETRTLSVVQAWKVECTPLVDSICQFTRGRFAVDIYELLSLRFLQISLPRVSQFAAEAVSHHFPRQFLT